MENNDFEKYLREQADKYWLEPDPGTFGRVMEAMQQGRKRRRFLFIFIFSLLGVGVLAGMLWWVTQNPSSFKKETVQIENNGFENKIKLPEVESANNQVNELNELKDTNVQENYNVSSNDVTTLSAEVNKNVHPAVAEKPKSQTNSPKVSVNNTEKESSKLKGKSDKSEAKINTENSKKSDYSDHAEEENGMPSAEAKNNQPIIINPESSSETKDSFTHPKIVNSDTSTQEELELEFIDSVTDTPKVKSKLRFLDPNRTKKWFISAWFNGFAAMSMFENNPNIIDSVILSNKYANYRTYYNTPRFGFSAGGSIGFSPIKYLTIELGVQYAEFTSLEKPQGYPNNPIDNMAPPDPFPLNVSSINEGQVYASNFKMLQIPLLFTFHWNWGKSGIHISAGPIFSYTTSYKGYAVSPSYVSLQFATNADSSGVQRFGIGIQSKVLYSYQILPNFSLFTGPTFQYRFNSLYDKMYLIRQYPYFIGLETGLRVNF